MFTVRIVAGDQDFSGLVDLRYRVLRAPLGLAPSSAHFAGDDAPGTLHIVAVNEADRVIGGASVIEQEGLQLRGMAVDPLWQGKGVGAAIVAAVEEVARSRDLPLWCNARVGAAGFYQKCGWAIEGDVFDIPVTGPHYKMRSGTP